MPDFHLDPQIFLQEKVEKYKISKYIKKVEIKVLFNGVFPDPHHTLPLANPFCWFCIIYLSVKHKQIKLN